jgi:hypothetical protein
LGGGWVWVGAVEVCGVVTTGGALVVTTGVAVVVGGATVVVVALTTEALWWGLPFLWAGAGLPAVVDVVNCAAVVVKGWAGVVDDCVVD